MKLIARINDGFTEHLLSWTLVVEGEVGHIVAAWLGDTDGVQKELTIPFDAAIISHIAEVIRELKPMYDGRVDDLPTYSLQIQPADGDYGTQAQDGVDWGPVEIDGVQTLMSVWTPLAKEIETAIAVPGRL